MPPSGQVAADLRYDRSSGGVLVDQRLDLSAQPPIAGGLHQALIDRLAQRQRRRQLLGRDLGAVKQAGADKPIGKISGLSEPFTIRRPAFSHGRGEIEAWVVKGDELEHVTSLTGDAPGINAKTQIPIPLEV